MSKTQQAIERQQYTPKLIAGTCINCAHLVFKMELPQWMQEEPGVSTFAECQRAWDSLSEPEPTEADAIREVIRIAEHYIGRAERALPDIDSACDLLASAMKELAEVATVESPT